MTSDEVQQNQQQRQQALTSNLQQIVSGATDPKTGQPNLSALAAGLMKVPEFANMGMQMEIEAAKQNQKPANPGYRQLDPTDPKDKAILAKLPPGSYQQSMDPNSPDYLKIMPTGSQSPMSQPPTDPTQQLPGDRERLAHMLIEGKLDPKSPMMRYIGPEVLARANFLDPTFNMQSYPTQLKARQSFAPGGQYNKNIVALGTAAQHIDLLTQYANAMQNNDVPTLNKLSQLWQTQTGSPLPTNFDAIKSTVAAEIAKANGEASLGALDQIQAPLNKAGSPAQLLGAIQGFKGLLAGKANALRQEYTGSGLGSSDEFNTKYFGNMPGAQFMTQPVSQVTQQTQQAPQAAIDALKANNTPQMQAFFKQKYGYLPP